MAAFVIALGAILTAINIVIGLRTVWKDWKARQEKPHALDAVIRDIAAAVRERDAKLAKLEACIKATEEARRRFPQFE